MSIIFRKVALAAAIAAGAATSPASAVEPVVLGPASQWNVDYAEDKCRLLRFFGGSEASERVVMVAEQHSPANQFEFMLAGKLLRGFKRDREATLRFGPAFPGHDKEIQVGELGEYSPAILFGVVRPDFAPEGVENEAGPSDGDIEVPAMIVETKTALSVDTGNRIEWVEVQQGVRSFRFETGSLGAAFGALNTCNENLLESWGVDLQDYADVAVQPIILNFRTIFDRVVKSYPRSALRAGQMATRRVRLLVDREGSVTDCLIIDTTIADQFDDELCDIYRENAEIEPARNSAGEPVASYLIQAIRYIIP